MCFPLNLQLGDEYFTFLEQCKDPKACTILLRGGSKDVLNEVERNLQDAMQVVRNVVFDPKLLPGGGATEMAIAVSLSKSGLKVEGVHQVSVLEDENTSQLNYYTNTPN